MNRYTPLPRRQMIDLRHLDLKCSVCGLQILELSFEPELDRPLFCRDCNGKRRDGAQG